jgi:MFS family permease
MQPAPASENTTKGSRFGRVLAAEAVSNFGSMLSRLAIPWLATLVLQATPWQMAALLLADVAAAAVGGLLLGAWVDAHGKRAVMLLADGARALLLLLLAAAAWRGLASFEILLVASLASGVLTVVFELARSAWVAQRVPQADLPQRNAQLSVAGSVSETLAFALGGWIYQGLGAALSLLVDALSFVASALCLRGVPEAPGSAAPAIETHDEGQGWWAEAGAGLRAVLALPVLRALAGAPT